MRPVFNLIRKVRLHQARKAEAVARSDYEAARLAYHEAYDRKDSRDKHRTFESLSIAAKVLLKAENASRDLSRSPRGVRRTHATLAVRER